MQSGVSPLSACWERALIVLWLRDYPPAWRGLGDIEVWLARLTQSIALNGSMTPIGKCSNYRGLSPVIADIVKEGDAMGRLQERYLYPTCIRI